MIVLLPVLLMKMAQNFFVCIVGFLNNKVTSSEGTSHFIVLCFIALRMCCVFYKPREDPPPSKRLRLTLLQYFIAVVCS